MVEYHTPGELKELFGFVLPDGDVKSEGEGGGEGKGKEGLLEVVEKVLRFSVNTWDQGFCELASFFRFCLCLGREGRR